MATNMNPVEKSPSDNRIYKAIRLQNQLECLLIRDVDAQKSSAALSMGVGSFKDPDTANGLAHYLEHMLFMGTTKYPDENQYSNFITKNSGSNNAYTGQEETNYMFEVSSTVFQQTLDRFAQFFIAPLLNQNSAEKQINAVDSQHQKNVHNDSWRKYQLTKHFSKVGHPYNKFSTGNKETLANQNLQAMLSEFYQTNYSSNLMKLVVYGKQQIQVMQEWVKEMFSAVPNKKLKRFQLDSAPFDEKSLNKIFKVTPVKDLKKLQLTWILPNKKEHYKHHPGNYVSNLIGHEGKGSILSYLIKQGLATSLSSGNYDNYNCYTEFQISIDLTEKGLTKIKQIIGYIFYYINNLRQNGCPEWFFEELQLINKLKFEFMDKKKGMMETAKIAKNMQQRNIQQLIVYPYLMDEWRPQLINQYLTEMKASNLIVICQAKQFEPICNLQEPVYKTKYAIEQIGDLTAIPCDISLPQHNIFLPKDLSLLELQPEKLPVQIIKSNFMDVFYKKDHIFKLPKANINMRLIFDGNFSVIEEIGRTILLEMLKQHLRQFVYLAEMAEIQVEISFVSYISLEIKFKGFRDSLKLFVVEYLKRIFEFKPVDESLFKTLIEKYRRKYANHFLDDPYKLAYGKSSAAMRMNSAVSEQQKLIQIQLLTLEQVQSVNQNWKKKLFLQSYFGGNLLESQALEIAMQVQKFLSAHSTPHKKQNMGQMRAVMLQANQIYIIEQMLHNKNEQNQSVVVSFQAGQLSIRSQLLLKLSELVLKQPAFDYLRTKQQLGYIVFCLAEDHRGAGGLMVLVQSAVKSSHEVIGYINIFIGQKAKQLIQGLTQEDFDTYKSSLKNTKQEKDKNLNAETTRYWGEIVKHKYIFDRKQKELDILSTITLQQFKNFVNQLFYVKPKRLQIHLQCEKKININKEVKNARCYGNPNFKVFESVESFNRKMNLFADFYAPNP